MPAELRIGVDEPGREPGKVPTGLNRGRPHHLNAPVELRTARMRRSARRDHRRLPAERREITCEARQPDTADPTDWWEVVRDDQDPSHVQMGRLLAAQGPAHRIDDILQVRLAERMAEGQAHGPIGDVRGDGQRRGVYPVPIAVVRL